MSKIGNFDKDHLLSKCLSKPKFSNSIKKKCSKSNNLSLAKSLPSLTKFGHPTSLVNHGPHDSFSPPSCSLAPFPLRVPGSHQQGSTAPATQHRPLPVVGGDGTRAGERNSGCDEEGTRAGGCDSGKGGERARARGGNAAQQ